MMLSLRRYYEVRSCRRMPAIHCLNKGNVKHICFVYIRKTFIDHIERCFRAARESIVGVDYKIFDATIQYYREMLNHDISSKEALSKALSKQRHKEAWFAKERRTTRDIMHFYQEVDIYPFRQPYLKRFGGHRWYRQLVDHVPRPRILEYGCGSAILTESLIKDFPCCSYTIADIPSVTLDFVKWKKIRLGFPYTILTIKQGKKGIPLEGKYDMIICQDVLEHTLNPMDIVESFVNHLSIGGVLLVDFINEPGGENVEVATKQREQVKMFLRQNLIALKEIDKPKGNDGLYVKDVAS